VPPAPPELLRSIAAHLTREIGAPVTVRSIEPLAGGVCQENYRLDIEVETAGARTLVMRSDALHPLPGSLDRREEFSVIGAAIAAGVKTPAARWLTDGLVRPGAHAYFLDFAPGVAIGRRVLRDKELEAARQGLAAELAAELARIHGITPASDRRPGMPCAPDFDPVTAALEFSRAGIEALAEPRPGLALALRWLVENPPRSREVTLQHGDFRVGNFLVTPEGLSAILDWEFAHWGCPAEDIAWIQMRNWRFGSPRRPIGGFALREPFYEAYERASGRAVVPGDVHFWEVLSNVRWATGCIQQGERYLSGKESDLELIAIPRRAVEMEFEALRLIEMGPHHDGAASGTIPRPPSRA
jgi:aminoglycoside phosphotransferase (APT) family kinase protein